MATAKVIPDGVVESAESVSEHAKEVLKRMGNKVRFEPQLACGAGRLAGWSSYGVYLYIASCCFF